MLIDGQNALVAGGGSGLGAATARHLASLGAKVAVLDYALDRAEAVASEIGGVAVQADVGDATQVADAVTEATGKLGAAPRIAVNCAGVADAARIVGREGKLSIETFEKVIRVNLIGTYNVMSHAAAGMTALDPLEGTTLTAKDMPNALAVIAMGPRGSMLHAPDVYMDKLAIGPGFAPNTVTLDMSPSERVAALAAAKGCTARDITVCVLERPRHEDIIAELRSTGAAIRLITDGDVAGVMHCAEPDITGIDMYMGSGGAPEGVLAAAALKCMGGQILGRLLFRNDDERGRAAKAGITDFDRVYTRDDLVTEDVIFAATGVTDGSLVHGIKREVGYVTAETILMRSKTGSVRRMIYRNPVA